MKLTIFAATGGIGRQLLDQAVAAGHGVSVVVRNPTRGGPWRQWPGLDRCAAATADRWATDRRAYRTAYGRNVRGGWSVSRADVAQLMLRVLELPETIKPAIGIAD